MDVETCRKQILSEDYWDFIISEGGGKAKLPLPPEEPCYQNAGEGFEMVYLERSLVCPINYQKYVYNSIPKCYALEDMDAMNAAGVSQVQYYPSLELMGEGIMVGFIDTGIDYTIDVFRNLDGTTRIAGIWDQTIQTGNLPEGFGYGSAYTEEEINEALKSETPIELVPTEDAEGHGTYLASIACGSGNEENRFLGAAPESTIAMVKLKPAKKYIREFYGISYETKCYQENDIMLGVGYLKKLADSYGMPLVLCVALGTNFGGHTGSSALAVMLQVSANTSNRIVITGTGNEANQRHHYQGQLDGEESERNVEVQVGDGVEAFSLEIWTDVPNLISISVVSPSGEVLPQLSVRQGRAFSFRFVFERTEAFVDNQIVTRFSSSQLIFMRFREPVPGIWKIIVEPLRQTGGTFHIWLPIKEFMTGEVIFLKSNPNTTLTEPSAAESVITVSHYNGKENSIDINSGRGYTRHEAVKPDFAAPGVDVTGALPGGRFASRTGSSAAAAVTAGASALLAEWLLQQNSRFLGYNTMQLKGLFILGAVRRPDLEYPNREWGYGTLNLYETLRTIREL